MTRSPSYPKHRAFLDAIVAAPDDLDLRLVFADWLDEHPGVDPDRGEFIRLQVELSRWPEIVDATPTGRDSKDGSEIRTVCSRGHDLRTRETALLAQHEKRWRKNPCPGGCDGPMVFQGSKWCVRDRSGSLAPCPRCDGSGDIGELLTPCGPCLGEGRNKTGYVKCDGTGIRDSRESIICVACRGSGFRHRAVFRNGFINEINCEYTRDAVFQPRADVYENPSRWLTAVLDSSNRPERALIRYVIPDDCCPIERDDGWDWEPYGNDLAGRFLIPRSIFHMLAGGTFIAWSSGEPDVCRFRSKESALRALGAAFVRFGRRT
jgi:uncharacterized protein (TIGR02996 family)